MRPVFTFLRIILIGAFISAAFIGCDSAPEPTNNDTTSPSTQEPRENNEASPAAPSGGVGENSGDTRGTGNSENVGEGTVDADTIQINIDGQPFSARLENTEAASTFVDMLPFTLAMSDLNGNEKFSVLDAPLPAGSERPDTIQAGDIMCWQGDTLVAFYETFPNSYGGYARIAHVDDAEGFAAALGSGNATVSFVL